MGRGPHATSGDNDLAAHRPLSALLSQVLVAFTVELDNEFERRMAAAGYPGAILSLVVWSNLIRFLDKGGVPVRDLAVQSLAPEKRVKFQLGCLERWGFVVLEAGPADGRAIPARAHPRAKRTLRDGWGSGRGIRSGWIVRLTAKGRQAAEIWPTLPGEIERRWQQRFGDDQIAELRQALEAVHAYLGLALPEGLPADWERAETYPAMGPHASGPLSLPVLLSQLLLAFTIEFDRHSRAPLRLCAVTLRVLGEQPIPVADIPRLTGSSPETSGTGWQIKPYILVEPDPAASRGKVVRLTPLGLATRQRYFELVSEIEKDWETRFGQDHIRRLRESLRELFVPRSANRALLAEGLVPAEGTIRAGQQAPALGRRDIAAAARQRMRDLVAQTEMSQRDPAASLPHYPLWDMNRGFGP